MSIRIGAGPRPAGVRPSENDEGLVGCASDASRGGSRPSSGAPYRRTRRLVSLAAGSAAVALVALVASPATAAVTTTTEPSACHHGPGIECPGPWPIAAVAR